MNPIRYRAFLLMTQEEVVNELIAYYAEMIPANTDFVANGTKEIPLPKNIMEKGILNLSPEELLEITEPWAEHKLVKIEDKMKSMNDIGYPPIAIIMTSPITDPQSEEQLKPYILSPLYKSDYNVPKGVVDEGYG
jgi:hypothetical protein